MEMRKFLDTESRECQRSSREEQKSTFLPSAVGVSGKKHWLGGWGPAFPLFFAQGQEASWLQFHTYSPSAGAGTKQNSINVHWVETRSKWMWKAMIRNLDVIWQTMGSRRSFLLGGLTCSEVHFREIGLAACGGWSQRERNWRQESSKNPHKQVHSGMGYRDGSEKAAAGIEI